ncbi:MAG: hypothetical protein AAGA86_11035 [Bacteroidota bacterium]
MKKYILPLVLLGLLELNAQAYPRLGDPHELKFNIGGFLATTGIEGSYEYFLNEDVSLGGTLYVDGDAEDFNGNFGIGPNLRAYFGFQPRSGFFAETFMLYYTGEDQDGTNNGIAFNNTYNTWALGLGLGKKWVTRSQRFTLELHGGLGRNLNPEDFQDSFMYRLGLSVGFRF